jgi:hypothetical protein
MWYLAAGIFTLLMIAGVNILIALVIQYVWNAAIVPMTGAGEISFLLAWLIGLVIYWLFSGRK